MGAKSISINNGHITIRAPFNNSTEWEEHAKNSGYVFDTITCSFFEYVKQLEKETVIEHHYYVGSPQESGHIILM